MRGGSVFVWTRSKGGEKKMPEQVGHDGGENNDGGPKAIGTGAGRRLASQPQFQHQGIVVRGGPELAHARFPVGGIAVPDHTERLDAGHHGRRGVEVVDSTPVSGTGEGEGVQPLPSLPSCAACP